MLVFTLSFDRFPNSCTFVVVYQHSRVVTAEVRDVDVENQTVGLIIWWHVHIRCQAQETCSAGKCLQTNVVVTVQKQYSSYSIVWRGVVVIRTGMTPSRGVQNVQHCNVRLVC